MKQQQLTSILGSVATHDDGTYIKFDDDSARGVVYARFGAAPREGRCHTCGHLCTAGVSLWCGNEVAVESHGTAIPGRVHCVFWKESPMDGPPILSIWERFAAFFRL